MGGTAGFVPPEKQAFASTSDLDDALKILSEKKDHWRSKTLEERKQYLQKVIDNYEKVYFDIARAASYAKGTDENGVGEELQNVTVIANFLNCIQVLLNANYAPKIPKVRQYKDHTIAQVYPFNTADKVLLMGVTGETWMEAGKPPTTGKYFREKQQGMHSSGKLSCVLGAGNVTSIPPTDVLSKLFIEDEVVILKMNPVNDYITLYLQKMFAPLVEDGFVRIVTGGGDVGAYLTQHESVDNVHITGSDKTHDLIVWGKDVQAQKEKGEPLLKKPITSELGCVTPFVVVPGPWSDGDIEYHARQLASAVVNNASCNCVAAKVIITCKEWTLRDKFLSAVEKMLSSLPTRQMYYPGSKEKYAAYVEHYGDKAKTLAHAEAGEVPWTIVRDVSHSDGEYALQNEAWSGVIAEVPISADEASPAVFLERAENVVNEKTWGTLSATVLVHPKTEKRFKKEFEEFIAKLKYGAIGINVWSSLSYALGVTVWGGHPGSTLKNVQSGIGVGHNLFMLDNAMKSVVRGPFRMWPTPAWFADNKNLQGTMKNFALYKAKPSVGRFLRVLLAGLRG